VGGPKTQLILNLYNWWGGGGNYTPENKIKFKKLIKKKTIKQKNFYKKLM
jgi:hypothetical protein